MSKTISTDKKATVIATGKEILVYKLKEGIPTPEHVWADSDPTVRPFAKDTYKESELKFHN